MKVVLVLSAVVIYACLIQTSTSAVLKDVALNMTAPSSVDIVKPEDSQTKQDMEKVELVLDGKTASPSEILRSKRCKIPDIVLTPEEEIELVIENETASASEMVRSKKAKLPNIVLNPEEQKRLQNVFAETFGETIKEIIKEVIDETIDEDLDSDSEDDKSPTKETDIMNLDMKVIPKDEKILQ